jgi:hypothetical protein
MRLVYFLFACVLVSSACSVSEPDATTASKHMTGDRSEVKLEFLTRDGCKNTPAMLENLKAAISTGKVHAQFTLVHQGPLPAEDPRNGYPTPTILLDGRDIFGLPVPQQPFPEPS